MSRTARILSPVAAAVFLVVVGGAYALHAARAGLAFLPDLNLARPPLAEVEPLITRAGKPASRRVVLVIIDGLGAARAHHLPYLDQLRRLGTSATARSHAPTISRPNYVSILTGVEPEHSGVRNNAYPWPVELDSVMTRARDAGLGSVYVADASGGFGQMLAHHLTDAAFTPWSNGFARAAALATRRGYPLVVLLPSAVDEAGHAHGAADPRYRQAAERIDAELREVLAGLDLTRDTIIITADHGHTGRGGHGGTEREVMEVPLILAGAGIRPGAAIDGPRLIDLAPTAAALLGLPAPGHGMGRTLLEALDLDPDSATVIAAADRARIDRNQAVVTGARPPANARVTANRSRRVGLALGTLALALGLIVAGRRVGALHVDRRVLVIAIPAFPLTFYGLLAYSGQHYSLSALPSEGAGIRMVFVVGLIATATHVVVAGFVALRGRVALLDRLAAANAVSLCGMIGAGLPALILWALYGGGPYLELPGRACCFSSRPPTSRSPPMQSPRRPRWDSSWWCSSPAPCPGRCTWPIPLPTPRR
jgi:2,3-bisphosphoglycerate-independent phosphoglycerate mutase